MRVQTEHEGARQKASLRAEGGPRVLRWETLTKRQFDAIDRSEAVVLLTCSPLEVHGPHLPLGADALEGEGLAERMLRFLPERHRGRTFLKLPFVYAATDTVPQPGSLHFRPSTTMTVLEDLGRTLAAQGFEHVLISNFHGGPRHFVAIEKACQRVQRRHGLGMIPLFSLLISRLTSGTSNLDDVLGDIPGVDKADLDGDIHGGLIETSQLLALHGEWVDPDYKTLPRMTSSIWARERRAAEPSGLASLLSRLLLTEDGSDGKRSSGGVGGFLRMIVQQRTNAGFFLDESYSGAPAGASAELGEQFLDTLGRHAALACSEILDGTLRPEQCHSPIWPLRFIFLNPIMIRLSNRLIGLRIPITS